MPSRPATLDPVGVPPAALPPGMALRLLPALDAGHGPDLDLYYCLVAELVSTRHTYHHNQPVILDIEARGYGNTGYMLWLRIPEHPGPDAPARLIPFNGRTSQPAGFTAAVAMAADALTRLHDLLDLLASDNPEPLIAAATSTDPLTRIVALSHPACTDPVRVASYLHHNNPDAPTSDLLDTEDQALLAFLT